MSTCISRHGEFGSHALDVMYRCTRCNVVDEDRLIAEVLLLQRELDEAHRFELGVADALGFENWEHPSDLFLQVRALQLYAENAEPYGECSPDCDCAGHEGPRTCDCHITGAEARERIEGLVRHVEVLELQLAETQRQRDKAESKVEQRGAHLDQIDDVLRSVGIERPLGAIGVMDLVAMADRMRPVVEAAVAWRPLHGSCSDPCRPERCGQKTCALTRAVDAYRSATPDAEPARPKLVTSKTVRDPHATGCLHDDDAAPAPGGEAFKLCACGHPWLRHDVEEYRGDGTETCCVEGCDQVGCLGRDVAVATRSAPGVPVDTEEESRDG